MERDRLRQRDLIRRDPTDLPEGGERKKDLRTLGGTEGRGNSKLNQEEEEEEEEAGIRRDPTEVDEEMGRDPRNLED